jgi:hypothetical protein
VSEQDDVLSALEQALRDAIAVATPERILRAITTIMVPRPAAEAVTSQFHGRVQKVSVSMPEDLALTIRERTGPGGFSRFVTEAAEKRLRGELLDEYLDELDEIYGAVPPEIMKQVKRKWPDFDEE